MHIGSALCAYNERICSEKQIQNIYMYGCMHLGQLSEIIQSVDDGHSFPQNDSLHDTP